MSTMAESHRDRAEILLKEGERLTERLQTVGAQESSQMHTDLLSIIVAATLAQAHIGLSDLYAKDGL